MDKYLSFVTIDVWTLIFTWCNLLILFLLMKKFLFGPIKNILKQRDDEINDMYEKAKKHEASAAEKESEYNTKLSSAKSEAASIVDNAVKNASVRSSEIVTEAEAKASSIIARADKQIELERQKAMSEIKSDISSLALDIAEKIIVLKAGEIAQIGSKDEILPSLLWADAGCRFTKEDK